MNRRLAVAATVAVLMCVAPFEASAQRVRASAPPAAPATLAPVTIDPSQIVAALAPCMLMLNLTPDQQLQIQRILVGSQPVFESLAARVTADHNALYAAAGAANVDTCVVGAAFMRRQASLDATFAQIRIVRNQIDAVLTVEQRAKLEGCVAAVTNLYPKP